MKIPSFEDVYKWLDDGFLANPGNWVVHSKKVGEVARRIASEIPEIDPDMAYIMGLVHDIGRYRGITKIRHSLDGYNFMLSKGYGTIGRVCITHSYPNKDIEETIGERDYTPEEENYVRSFLSDCEYDDYDLLIQLCDSMVGTEVVLIETRLIDIALRYGLQYQSGISLKVIKKWDKFYALHRYFSDKIGHSIYDLFPELISNNRENKTS